MKTPPIPMGNMNWEDPATWNTHATQYDEAAGRSSRLGARHLISLTETLSPSLSSHDARAIDLGCGTGALTFELSKICPNLPILATDISPGMIDQLKANPSMTPNITAEVADMRNPVSGSAVEGSFSHVFSTMAVQALRDPAGEGILAEWARLLKSDGIVAIGIWVFDENCGPHALWAQAAKAVDPNYVNPPLLPEGHWLVTADLEEGLKAAGFRDVKAEEREIGFDVGKEGFLRWFWESGSGSGVERRATFKGDLGKVRVEMERLLDVVYDGGKSIPLSVGLAVGRKPKTV